LRSWSEVEGAVNDEHVYKVIIGESIIELTKEFLPERVKPCLGIVGKGVAESAPWVLDELKKVYHEVLVLPDGENAKTLGTVLDIVERLWHAGADRWCALGVASGGSLGDAAAFAASIYLRGIPLIFYPTTLLSMIDSSLGGKTAVNWKGYKNILGSFYHPWLVIDDLRFVRTLPQRVYKSSLAESLKYGITLDKEFLEFMIVNKNSIMERNNDVLKLLIKRSVELKLSVVALDPRERKGVREVLNFGHTVGHVLESASSFQLLHGEAVALGMLVEAGYAQEKNYCPDCFEEVNKVLRDYDMLSVQVSRIDKEKYVEMLKRDKKRVGDKLRLPVLTGLGKWKLEEVPIREFADITYEIMEKTLRS